MVVFCCHPTNWLARPAYTAQAWGLGRQTGKAAPGDCGASAAISAHTGPN